MLANKHFHQLDRSTSAQQIAQRANGFALSPSVERASQGVLQAQLKVLNAEHEMRMTELAQIEARAIERRDRDERRHREQIERTIEHHQQVTDLYREQAEAELEITHDSLIGKATGYEM